MTEAAPAGGSVPPRKAVSPYAPGKNNPRGIPAALFVEDLDEYMKDKNADDVLRVINEAYSKYKLMEQRLTQQKASLKAKIPDLEKTIEAVQQLVTAQAAPEPLEVDYQLSDMVFAKARLDKAGTVGLWLGANVMLQYPYAEAIELLTRNLNSARETLKVVTEDLAFLKEQITVSEVSIARAFNFDVKKRRELREAAAAAAATAASSKPAEPTPA